MANNISPFASNLGVTVEAAQKGAANPIAKLTSGIDGWESAKADDLRLNWNKLFPYQLIIMRREGSEWFQASGRNYLQPFTLPIPPQSLNIDMPFASSVEATQGGVIEQNNGAPFRDISLSGTTGVLPLRGSVERPAPSTALNIVGGIFAGTVAAAQNTAQSATSLFKNTLGIASEPVNVIPDSNFESDTDLVGRSTGYYQFLLLKRFLEWYANIKKTAAGQNIALGFAVWKEQEIYLVTPLRFTVSRAAGRALHYQYSLNLRAWRRVTSQSGGIGKGMVHPTINSDPNYYARVMNGLDTARRTLENSKKVIEAVRGDANRVVFGTARQAILFAKDVLGVGFALKDMGEGLVKDFDGPILEKIALGQKGLEGGRMLTEGQIAESLGIPVSARTDPELLKTLSRLKSRAQLQEAASGLVRSEYKERLQQLNPRGGLTDRDRAALGDVQLTNLPLSSATAVKITDAVLAVRDLTRSDFQRFRETIQSVLSDFSQAVGVGDATVSAVYSIPYRPPLRSEPTDLDWRVMDALSSLCENLDALAASRQVNPQDTLRPIDYIAGLAQASGIAFTVPRSKYLIPFPYGYTLEQLSAQYLGTPDRWLEIAALNGLKAPYVDEVGVSRAIAANGNGNQVALEDAQGLYVGQQVWISATGVRREKRRITRIDPLTDVTLITLDGLSDLNRYTVADNAQVQFFAPHTTNSMQFIYMPSDSEAETDWQTKSIPGIDFFDPLVRVGGVDLLIDHSGDLVVTSDGTTRLAIGLTNLIQRVRIAVSTPQGSLMRHPEFGFGVNAGSSTSEVTAQQVLQAAKDFVRKEEGFSGVDYAAVRKVGNSLMLSLSVGIEGVNKNVPISVQLR